jgi:hypothetical protein
MAPAHAGLKYSGGKGKLCAWARRSYAELQGGSGANGKQEQILGNRRQGGIDACRDDELCCPAANK